MKTDFKLIRNLYESPIVIFSRIFYVGTITIKETLFFCYCLNLLFRTVSTGEKTCSVTPSPTAQLEEESSEAERDKKIDDVTIITLTFIFLMKSLNQNV